MGNLLPQLKIINNIYLLRAEQRLTQQELAVKIGVTRATVGAIEKGSYNPSLELAFRISQFFNKDIQEIFTIDGGKHE